MRFVFTTTTMVKEHDNDGGGPQSEYSVASSVVAAGVGGVYIF